MRKPRPIGEKSSSLTSRVFSPILLYIYTLEPEFYIALWMNSLSVLRWQCSAGLYVPSRHPVFVVNAHRTGPVHACLVSKGQVQAKG